MIGKKIHDFAKQLWPLNRSITGNGVRQTLNIIKEHISELKIYSVPSGTQVFDWNIPEEWNVTDAYVIDKYNNKIQSTQTTEKIFLFFNLQKYF